MCVCIMTQMEALLYPVFSDEERAAEVSIYISTSLYLYIYIIYVDT